MNDAVPHTHDLTPRDLRMRSPKSIGDQSRCFSDRLQQVREGQSQVLVRVEVRA
jgi:hypothetical protein